MEELNHKDVLNIEQKNDGIAIITFIFQLFTHGTCILRYSHDISETQIKLFYTYEKPTLTETTPTEVYNDQKVQLVCWKQQQQII